MAQCFMHDLLDTSKRATTARHLPKLWRTVPGQTAVATLEHSFLQQVRRKLRERSGGGGGVVTVVRRFGRRCWHARRRRVTCALTNFIPSFSYINDERKMVDESVRVQTSKSDVSTSNQIAQNVFPKLLNSKTLAKTQNITRPKVLWLELRGAAKRRLWHVDIESSAALIIAGNQVAQ